MLTAPPFFLAKRNLTSGCHEKKILSLCVCRKTAVSFIQGLKWVKQSLVSRLASGDFSLRAISAKNINGCYISSQRCFPTTVVISRTFQMKLKVIISLSSVLLSYPVMFHILVSKPLKAATTELHVQKPASASLSAST